MLDNNRILAAILHYILPPLYIRSLGVKQHGAAQTMNLVHKLYPQKVLINGKKNSVGKKKNIANQLKDNDLVQLCFEVFDVACLSLSTF